MSIYIPKYLIDSDGIVNIRLKSELNGEGLKHRLVFYDMGVEFRRGAELPL
ncbi:MAG: hypothetical protein LBC04_02685 [Holosporaceae bacterium]|nr:hypothetical protein [Holosporaceae bacterium]